MIPWGRKVTVSAFPANTPLALNLWLPCEAKELCQEVTLCDCEALWEFKIMSMGIYKGRPGDGVRHRFRSRPLNILFVLWPQLQINSTLPTLPKLKKFTVVIQVVGFWVIFIFFVLFYTFCNIYSCFCNVEKKKKQQILFNKEKYTS